MKTTLISKCVVKVVILEPQLRIRVRRSSSNEKVCKYEYLPIKIRCRPIKAILKSMNTIT